MRPRSLTPDKAQALLAALEEVGFRKYAAPAADIPTRTLETWMSEGRAELERFAEGGPEPGELGRLFAAVTASEGSWVRGMLAVIMDAAIGGYRRLEHPTEKNEDGTPVVEVVYVPPNPQWAAWLLSRKDNLTFGSRAAKHVTVDGDGRGGPVRVEEGRAMRESLLRQAAREAGIEENEG